MMSVADATNTNGTVLGGIVTFILYGILPTSIIIYIMGAPRRKKVRLAREQEALAVAKSQNLHEAQVDLTKPPNLKP
jgi:hypothetical protein